MAEYAKELWQFVCDVVWNWGNATTGGVIVALLWLYTVVRQTTIPRKVGIGVAVTFLLFSAFNAWREQYQAREVAQNKLEIATTPNLQGRINGMFSAPSGEAGENGLLTIIATIKNTGAPSIADNFWVSVTKNGRSFHTMPVPAPKDFLVLQGRKDGNDSAELRYTNADYLPGKAISQPIATGGAAWGFVQVVVGGLKQEDIGGANITINFVDVTGKGYAISRIFQQYSEPIPDLNRLSRESAR